MTLFLPDEAYRDNPQLSDVYRMPRYMQSPQAYKEELLRRRSQPPGTQVALQGPQSTFEPAVMTPELEQELRRPRPQGPQVNPYTQAGQRPSMYPGQKSQEPRPQGPDEMALYQALRADKPQVNPYTQAGQRPSMYPGQNVPPFSPYQQQPQQPFSPYGAGFNAGYRPPPFQPMQTPPPPPQQMGGKGGGMPSQGAFGQFAPQPMQPQPYQPMQTPPPPPQQMGGKGGGMPSQGGYTSSGMRPQPATPYQPMQTPPPPPQQMGGKGGGMPPQGGYNTGFNQMRTQEHPDVRAKPNSSPFGSAIGGAARGAMF